MDIIKNNKIAFALALLFVIANAFFIYKEIFYVTLVPVLLLVMVAAVFWQDKLLLAIVFLVPLSVPLSEAVEGLEVDLFLPTEPLLAGLLIVFVIKFIYDGNFDKKILTHPVSLTIYASLTWMLITTITSTMPLVSIKQFISRIWFLVAFYFLASQLFHKKEYASRYIASYAIALGIVVVYALARHATYGILDEKIAHWSANPFYKDHTSYGALLAFLIPPVIGLTFFKGYKKSRRLFFGALLTLLILGIIFSFSRAAWLSLIGGFGLWVLIKLRIKFSLVLTIFVGIALILAAFSDSISKNLESNRQDSSDDFAEHIQSIGNVSTDASNLERINRWSCAFKMFKEKPVFGWGPGTYMFQYAPYQESRDKTIISTQLGDMGNAHSEYLGPLSEQGLMGPILFLITIIFTMVYGIRAIHNTKSAELKMIGISVIVGLFTYYLHGFLNNFLDTDKASAPFWGFTAFLVFLDIYNRNQEKKALE